MRGQRSDRLWEVRRRVAAAYYVDGELVGVEDPDGGGLVRSERFSLRGPLSGAFAEVAAVAFGLLFLGDGWRRRTQTAGLWSDRNADEPADPPASGAAYAVLGSVAGITLAVAFLLDVGAAWWFVLIVLAAIAAGGVWLVRLFRRQTARSSASRIR